MVVITGEENESVMNNVEEIKTTIVKNEDVVQSEQNREDVETRDEVPDKSPEIESTPEEKPKEAIETTPTEQQGILTSSSREGSTPSAKFHDHNVTIDLKFWQDAFSKIIYSRLTKLATCNTSCESVEIDEEELKAMFSNYDGEGTEIDEHAYREQIKVFADYVATNAIIPKGNEDCFGDDIDPEERKLEYTVRREIASAVIGEKMLKGYTQQDIPCLKCGMPLMKFHGVIDCVVCPVLVKEIDKALKIRREKFLNQKVENARRAVLEAEAKKKADEEALENLKLKEATLRNNSTLLSAAAEVAAEQVVAASSKNYDVRKELDDARRVSAEAWALVQKRIDELKVEIEQSKRTIEKAVATIEQTAAERKQINMEMSAKVKEAIDSKADAESELDTATREEHDASVSAAAAAEAVRLALLAQAAADQKYKEAQELVKALELVVEEKTINLTDMIQTAEKVNKKANDEVQKAVRESAKIERETTAKVTKAHNEKNKAEEIAKKLEEEKMHKEAKALVAERLAQLAIESKEKAIADAKDIKNKIIQSGEEMKLYEQKICTDRETLETRKKIAMERLEAVTKLRRELQMQLPNENNGDLKDSNDNEARDSCSD